MLATSVSGKNSPLACRWPSSGPVQRNDEPCGLSPCSYKDNTSIRLELHSHDSFNLNTTLKFLSPRFGALSGLGLWVALTETIVSEEVVQGMYSLPTSFQCHGSGGSVLVGAYLLSAWGLYSSTRLLFNFSVILTFPRPSGLEKVMFPPRCLSPGVSPSLVGSINAATLA